jgi:aldose 1-epimerase
MKLLHIGILAIALVFITCKSQQPITLTTEKIWGYSDNNTIKLITLSNRNGMQVKVTNYGATLTWVSVPDRNGVLENVVLGFDSLSRYLAGHPTFGSVVGRYANRISGAKFILNGSTYNLFANSGGIHTLHGGKVGFDKKVFNIEKLYAAGDSSVLALSYLSPDMEEGFPGNLKLTVTYVLTAKNEIKIDYLAETDKPTVVNFTNHSYFNLSACKEDVLNHELVLYADSITPTDKGLIPTGILESVTGTPYDFINVHKIGERIASLRAGYDINYKLRKKGNEISLAAEAYEPKSGRLMQTYTTEPGLQLYTSNFLRGYTGYNGIEYKPHYGLCLEAQHFPDSPNKPQFPSTLLLPGEKYRQVTIYRFSVR